MVLRISDAWREAYPESRAGVLVISCAAPPSHAAAFEQRKRDLQNELRQRHAGHDRRALQAEPALTVYVSHYRRFSKSYHVLLQLESILFKGKSIPTVSPLVDAMFMAEMSNHLLTAGHDLDSLRLPLMLDVARGTESYVLLQGEPHTPKAGDMMISDAAGIISSIVYGPDQRSRIGPGTRNALYTTYAPAGITEAALDHHMHEIYANVQLTEPGSRLESLAIFG
jgi:DNA/RNA-binding domain of Phe-tRNA-synthetase-like protein